MSRAPQVTDRVWSVGFLHYDRGFFDDQCSRVECAPNPFGAKKLPVSPEWTYILRESPILTS